MIAFNPRTCDKFNLFFDLFMQRKCTVTLSVGRCVLKR